MTQPSHTAFITGASSGIGAIYAERLAARGYNLILTARREDRLQALADQLQARYAIQASILKADLSEEHGIAAVEQRLQQDPAIDLFINNAGTAKLAGFLASTPREHQAIHTLNTTALLRLSYAALAAFTPRRRGTLINIASILALHTLPGSAVYSASKACVKAYGEALRVYLAPKDIQISVICPGFVKSRITDKNTCPMPFFMPAEKAAGIIGRGLENNVGLIAFPWPMRLAVWFLSVLPNCVSSFICSKLPYKV